MVFRRRDKRPIWKIVLDALWPKGGWGRAAQYVKHRLRRLPDAPDRIARGIFVGVFTTFTPFYGLHFVVAALLAKIMNGNILAALLSTFFGNPLTYVPIGYISLKTGFLLLGQETDQTEAVTRSLGGKFADAFGDLWHNFLAMFTPEKADWTNLTVFYDEVFFPYMIGGIVPGIVTGTIAYYLSLPLITAYQKRRAGAIKAKLDAIRDKAAEAKAKAKGKGRKSIEER